MKSQKSKKPPQFSKRKKAFDSVLAAFRDAKDTNGGIGSIVLGAGGKGVMNPVRPSLTDFRCDVMKVLNHCLRTYIDRLRFRLAYLEFDSESSIEREMFADKVFGSGRHSIEQGVGARLISKGVYPLYGKGAYFTTIRQPRGSV